MDYIPKKFRLTPIGRLDQNTTGLLLFTNDGDLQQFLTHPKNNIPKEYEAIIEGRLTTLQKRKIKKGIYIGFKEFGKAEIIDQVTEKTRSKVTLRLRQGKKREIRRIFFKLKLKLFSLKRIAFSKIKRLRLNNFTFNLKNILLISLFLPCLSRKITLDLVFSVT